MGIVFGKVDVAEPAYDVVVSSGQTSRTSWEIRRYGTRFAIEAAYPRGVCKDDRTPFMELAGYIGVMSAPQNEGATTIAMTAPVAIEREHKETAGTKIAMTAPVSVEGDKSDGSVQKMQFFLPAEYDSMSKIPKPTNPDVKVVEVPPAVGAVHSFNGAFNQERSREKATELVKQLHEDGMKISEKEETEMIDTFQSWGYNPPFTIPYFKRNEVWVPLKESQVEDLMKSFPEGEVKN